MSEASMAYFCSALEAAAKDEKGGSRPAFETRGEFGKEQRCLPGRCEGR